MIAWSAIPWPTVTTLGLCVSVMWVVVKGRLVPRSWVDKAASDQDKRIEFLEKTNAEQRTTINSLVQQNAELTVSGRLSVALLESLQKPKPLSSNTDPGSGHVAPSITE